MEAKGIGLGGHGGIGRAQRLTTATLLAYAQALCSIDRCGCGGRCSPCRDDLGTIEDIEAAAGEQLTAEWDAVVEICEDIRAMDRDFARGEVA